MQTSTMQDLTHSMLSLKCLTITANIIYFLSLGITSLILLVYPTPTLQHWLGLPKHLLQQSKYLLALETEFEFAIMSLALSVGLLLIVNSKNTKLIENATAGLFGYWCITLAFRTYLGYTRSANVGLPTFFALIMCVTAWSNYFYPINFKNINSEVAEKIDEIASHEVENQTVASSSELLGAIKSAA